VDNRERRVFVFDLGNVVCDFVPERRRAALAATSGHTEAEIEQLLFGGDLLTRCDRGLVSSGELCDLIRTRIGVSASDGELAALWALAFRPNDSVLDIVDEVSSFGETALLTDNPKILLGALQTELPSVASRFNRVFFSCEIGVCKPNPKVFEHVTQDVAVKPGDIFFVDDGRWNVAAARRVGWRAHWFESAANLRAAYEAGDW
jgi:putative hydrolase of the HAD superfamily